MKSFPATAVLFVLGSLANVLAGEAEAPPAYNPKLAAASDAGETAIKGFKLAEGLKCQLFAAEPMLANPVCLEVDHLGRVYVVETFRHSIGVDTGSMGLTLDQDLSLRTVQERIEMLKKRWGNEVEKFTKEHDRIRIIEDTDGDGKADKASVYADGFNGIPDGIGAGLLAFNPPGSAPAGVDLFYTCIPNLWKLRDSDSDGKADTRKSLSYGYGVHGGYLGHDLHGLRMGPDGRIYYTVGDRGMHVVFEGKTYHYPDQGVCMRCNPDGSELEVFAHGLRNPQELAFDEFGNLFTGDNNSDGGDKARWVYIVQDGDCGWRDGYQYIPANPARGNWNAEKLWQPYFKGQAAYINPPIANFGNGPSGLTYYPGTGLGEKYNGTFFLVDFRGGPNDSGVHAFKLKPKGAGFEIEKPSQFFWRVLGTDAEFGPDGALYLCDWVQGWGKPNKGRVYKVFDPVAQEDALVKETKKLLNEGMQKRSNEELAKLLAHPDMRVRQGAQFQLAFKGAEVVAMLEGIARTSTARMARIHALWALGQIERALPKAAAPTAAYKVSLALLADKDAEIRAQAVKLLGECKSAVAKEIIPLLKDENARVRFFAGMALSRHADASIIEPVFAMLRENADEDPNLRHAGVTALAGIKDAALLLEKRNDPSPFARMGILLALRRQENPQIALFLKDADSALVLEAARAINDIPIPDAMEKLAEMVKPSDAKTAVKEPEGLRLTLEYWTETQGNQVTELTKNPNFPGKPTSSTELSIFEIPADIGDNYGTRVSGLITAPKDGEYTFYVCGDDSAELFLSTSEKPEDKKRIASFKEYTDARQWDKYPEQASQPVTLKAGQKYYIETLHKEGGGGDHLAVGWKLPDGKMQRPIGSTGDSVGTPENVLLLLRALNANFRVGKDENARALAAYAARNDVSSALRVEALYHLTHWAPAPSALDKGELRGIRDRIMNTFRPIPARSDAAAIAAIKPEVAGLLLQPKSDIQLAAAQLAAKYQLSDAGPALLALVSNEKSSGEARTEALKALAALKHASLYTAVTRALNDKNVKLRQEAGAQLAKLNPDEAIPMLEGVLKNGAVPEKQSSLMLLAKMKKPAADKIVGDWMDQLLAGKVAPEMQLDVIESVKGGSDAKSKEKLKQYEAAIPKDNELAPFKVTLAGGDAELGKKVFFEHATGQCLRCHKNGGHGGEVGPELLGVATKRDRNYLLESIVAPNNQIAEGFEMIVVAMTDGRVQMGILKGDTDKQLTLLPADGKPITIPKDQIKTRKSQKQSAMPPMGEVLSKVEIRNLLEYLSTLK